jgi:hypothetical protein
MKKALFFSLFLSIGTFYGIQKNAGYFKEKFGITGLPAVAGGNYVTSQNNKIILSIIDTSKQEPSVICIKVEGRLYCKASERTI